MIQQSGFACLTYHVVGNEDNQYAVSARQLRDHLSFLRQEAFTVEGFDGLEARLKSGDPLPESYVVMTWDDGHHSSVQAADILSEYGCGATFFVTRDRSEYKSGFIRRSEIRELRARGFSIGTYGTTHLKLTFLPESSCRAELVESKSWLEEVLGETVRYWAAPGGYVNRRVTSYAESQGYVLTGTCREWMNSGKQLKLPAQVNRVNVRKSFSVGDIKRIVYGDLAFYSWRQIRSAALYVPKQVVRG